MKDPKNKLNIRIIVGSLLFDLFILIWTILWGGIGLFFSIISKKTAQKVGNIWALVIIFVLRILCNVKFKVEGLEHINDKTTIIASKHESAWDTIFFLKYFKNTAYILKRELLFFPILGQYLMLMRMIAINRSKGKKSIIEIKEKTAERLKEGRLIVIFPQGTRTEPSSKKPYKSGIYAVAKDNSSHVTPISLNSGTYWGKNAIFKYPGTIKVKIHPPIPVGDDKKKFMAKLEDAIEAGVS